MTKCKLPQNVDIIIYTKDRPMQLHLLLESLQKYVTGIGTIVITMQFSSPDYQKAYGLLKARLRDDAFFQPIRDKASIVFHERKSLEESIESLSLLGNSEYILPLADDAVFYRYYDLLQSEVSKYFFRNKRVLNCSIRLGKNITPTIPELHKDALFEKPQPEFVLQTEQILGWHWPEAMNTFEWCNPAGMCIIFRKSTYFGWFHKFKNPVWMEGDVKRYLEDAIFKLPAAFNHFLRLMDRVQQKLLGNIFGIYKSEIFRQFLSKVLFKIPFIVNENVLTLIIAPRESVVFMMDVNSTLPSIVWRNKVHSLSFEELNLKYLEGFKVSPKFLDEITVDCSAPWNTGLREHFQFEEYHGSHRI